MKRAKALAATSIAIVVFAAGSAAALTTEEVLAQLQALYQQMLSVQAQLQTPGAVTQPTITRVTNVTGIACVLIPTNIGPGQRDAETGGAVSTLQSYLVRTGDYTYPEITGYFGAATEAAVKRYQTTAGIVSSGSPSTNGFGAVGPRTREYIRVQTCVSTYTPAPTPAPTPTTPVVNQSAGCTVDGRSIASGSSMQLYSTRSVPGGLKCADFSSNRVCTNGTLSGDAAYQYASCSITAGKTCSIGNFVMASGESRPFYDRTSVSYSDTCEAHSQTRSCVDGVVSGGSPYTYPGCTRPSTNACTVDGITLPHGSSTVFYSGSSVPFGSSCSSISQSRSCSNGVLSGSDSYNRASCAPTPGTSCSLDGATIIDGTSRPFYFLKNIPANEVCSSYAQSRSCANGTLGGNATYKYASCTPVTSSSCALDDVVLANGASGTFYSTSTAPAGQSCTNVQTTRTCSNGSLSGNTSYNRATCTATASCTQDGVTLGNASSSLFYSARTVDFGQTCASRSQTRTCTNGDLSGSDTYEFATCSVNPPVASSGTRAQLAAALEALESLVRSFVQSLF